MSVLFLEIQTLIKCRQWQTFYSFDLELPDQEAFAKHPGAAEFSRRTGSREISALRFGTGANRPSPFGRAEIRTYASSAQSCK